MIIYKRKTKLQVKVAFNQTIASEGLEFRTKHGNLQIDYLVASCLMTSHNYKQGGLLKQTLLKQTHTEGIWVFCVGI